MSPSMTTKRYSTGEEIFSSVTHGVGTVFGIVATTLLVVWAALMGSGMSVACASIYGATLTIMYCMSTLYHAFPFERVKALFRIFDHCSIYLLIAGTYTPVSLLAVKGRTGVVLLSVVWGAAILGIILNSISLNKFKVISMILYIIMGWAALFTIKAVYIGLGLVNFVILMVGGFFYTVGIVFYAMKKVRYMHSIWHLFVLFGSIAHFICVFRIL